MFDKINLMVPSFKRPGMLATCINSAIETAEDKECLRFTVMLHIGDESYKDFDLPTHTCIMYENEPEPNLSFYYNKMYAEGEYQNANTLVSMIGDDMRFITKGWDKKILDKANEIDGIGIIHCDDDYIQHGAIAVNLFTSRVFVDACGPDFMCPEFKRFWIDTIWTEIATMTDANYYLSDVIIKHEHTSAKGAHDDTYNRLEGIGQREICGSIEDSKNRIWPHVYKAVANLKRSGLI